MRADPRDRTVHVTIRSLADDTVTEVVRYNRSGKWWLESADGRQQLTFNEAVAKVEDRPLVTWHEGRAGGRMFDATVRARRRYLRTAESSDR